MGTLTIIALAGNYQITKIITERFPDGSYSFIPDHFDEMLETTVIFSIILIASLASILTYWKKRKKRNNVR